MTRAGTDDRGSRRGADAGGRTDLRRFGYAIGAFESVAAGLPWDRAEPFDGGGTAANADRLTSVFGLAPSASAETRIHELRAIADAEDTATFRALPLRRRQNFADRATARAALEAAGALPSAPFVPRDADVEERREAVVAAAVAEIDLVRRIERRLREAGLLDHPVESDGAFLVAESVATAVQAVRAGRLDRAQLDAALASGADACAVRYDSWRSFAAAFVVGRVRTFAEHGVDAVFDDTVRTVRALLADATGPWSTVAWPPLDVAA